MTLDTEKIWPKIWVDFHARMKSTCKESIHSPSILRSTNECSSLYIDQEDGQYWAKQIIQIPNFLKRNILWDTDKDVDTIRKYISSFFVQWWRKKNLLHSELCFEPYLDEASRPMLKIMGEFVFIPTIFERYGPSPIEKEIAKIERNEKKYAKKCRECSKRHRQTKFLKVKKFCVHKDPSISPPEKVAMDVEEGGEGEEEE